MNAKRIVLIVAILGATATGAYALYLQTGENSVFYYEVDEYLSSPELQASPKVRLSGVVRAGSIVRDAAEMRLQFAMEGKTKDVLVKYQGAVPDIFQDGVQVVVEGAVEPQSQAFVAETLLAKCPSKYEKSGKPEDFEGVGRPKQHPMDPAELRY